MKEIYFLSSNEFKIAEIKNMLSSNEIKIIPVNKKISEIQSDDKKSQYSGVPGGMGAEQ